MPAVVIIGAGLSGLSCAVLMAEHGWDVTVLEQHFLAGGLMQRFKRGPFHFDTGFHFITGGGPDGIFRKLAHRLGILDRMRFLPLDQSAQIRVHIPGGPPVDLPVGIDACERALQARAPEQAEPIARFFRELKGYMIGTDWLACMVPADTPPPVYDGRLSTTEIMDRCGLTGLPRGVLGGMSAVLAMDPETCPFHLYSGYVSTSLSGAWRAEGGGEAITAPLVARLGELGGKLLLKQGAARIHWQDREATAVEDEKGVQHPCDMVIATCHPQETMRLVGPGGLRPSLEERIPVIPDSNSAVLAYAALSRPPTCLGQSHHFSRIGEDGYLYYLAPSNFVPPAHDHPPYLEAMLWVPCDSVAAWRDSSPAHRPEAYQAWKRQQERQLLDAVIAQFPELAGTVTKTWSATPLTIERYVRSRHGAAIGLSHDLAYLGNDPLPRRSRLKNLCFAGQSIGHAGVVGCLIDGFILLQFILERDLRAEVMAGTGPSR